VEIYGYICEDIHCLFLVDQIFAFFFERTLENNKISCAVFNSFFHCILILFERSVKKKLSGENVLKIVTLAFRKN
jgi:hypothetical protein